MIINNYVNSNIYKRIIGEAIGAFFLIFITNLGITLGEAGVLFFDIIYNVNFAIAIWIGTWTFIAFLFFEKTTISSNFVSLTISFKNKIINKNEFIILGIFQLIFGLIASIFVWLIANFLINGYDVSVMGGATPHIKDLFVNTDSFNGMKALVWNPIIITNNWQYVFSIFQGLLCALLIIILFLLNNFFDNKFKRDIKAKVCRYIILIVGISITTILSANTTNWVRMLAPAIVNQVESWVLHKNSTMLATTIIFIIFQSIGLIFIYYSKFIYSIKK